MYRIGVDIGGSHITAALVDSKSGKILEDSLTRAKIDPHADAEEILSAWSTAIQKTRAHLPERISYSQILGFAMPGPFDYVNGISLMTKQVAKYEKLYGVNVKVELSNRLEIAPQNIQFRNDSEAFLEGEMNYGSGKNFTSGIGLTLGTGLGTSIYQNGKAKDMGLGITYPFKESVIEEYISTRWFVSRYQSLAQKKIHGAKELIEAYDSDPIARQLMEEFAQNLGDFILEFVKIHYPEVIIMGGNIAEGSAYFFPQIEAKLAKHTRPIVLTKSALNERAALIGSIV